MEFPKNMQWTKQRKCVYQLLYEAKEPLSAHQIYSRIMQRYPEESYALSTIYRILSAFEENGLVESTTWIGDDTVVYELHREEHRHYAVCLECHKRIPLQHCPFAHAADVDDFIVTGHKIEIYGYCKDCKEPKKHELHEK